MGGGGDGVASWYSKVLRHIRRYYKEALEQLPVEEIPSLLAAGACIGLLDPVSNIIVNTATAGAPKSTKKRKRSEKRPPTDKGKALALAAAGIAKRSLEGLLTFLVCHFRHLGRLEALRYLSLADADLLVAAGLIDLDRRATPASNPSSTTLKVALKCAAISAKHPCRAQFAGVWLPLATSPPGDQKKHLLLGLSSSSHPRLQDLLLTLPDSVGLGQFHTPQQLQALQRNRDKKVSPPPELTESRAGRLLDMIHLLYLKAIAHLPRDTLRVRHHRGLLRAGHCVGPMDDPVSNILLNTIWYDTVFPPQNEFLVDMLRSSSLVRLDVRSAVGLIKFLCTRFPGLAQNHAIVLLLEAGANLHEAVSIAKRQGHNASGSLEEAYREAARAAWHPEPEALAKFALSTNLMVSPAAMSLQRMSDRSLSADDVHVISAFCLAALESPSSCSHQSTDQLPELSTRAVKTVERHQDIFHDDQFSFRCIAEAALESLETKYQLHVICGVNPKVAEKGKHGYYDLKDGFPYCHINFLARPWGSPVGTVPKLFFAECSNDDEDTKVVTCCLLDPSTDAGRCFHCEKEGSKIVHPSFGSYDGCDIDFKQMARGRSLTCSELICRETRRTTYKGFLLHDDSVYFDPQRDFKFIEWVNEFELLEEENERKGTLYSAPFR